MRAGRALLSLCLCGLLASPASHAEDFEWDWDVSMGLGYFSFRNSLFRDIQPDPPDDLGESWMEFFFKPGAEFSWKLPYGEIHAGVNWAFSATSEDASAIVGGGNNHSDLDELWIGWVTGNGDDDGWLVGGGRYPYRLGKDFLISDGYADGGDRAGYWSNPRRAWEMGGVVSYLNQGRGAGVFYLERDERPDADTDTKIYGVDVEWRTQSDLLQLGATWMELEANELAPQRDGVEVINLRVYTNPLATLQVDAEWVDEDNGEALQANAWYVTGTWNWHDVDWTPSLTYRYAWFEGDNPDTPANENYDPLFPGFQDWGTWFQGEIAGGYFLSNSNLKTHFLTLKANPIESLRVGIAYFDYALDEPRALDPDLVSDDIGQELDLWAEWQVHDYWSFYFVLARMQPGQAVKQVFDRQSDFKYGMVYLNFNY